MFTGRTDVGAETPILWPPHAKSWLIGKDSDAVRDWVQEKKGMTEDEIAGWHHGLDGRESEWTPGVGDGQRGLACCDSWGCKESDTTERLNWIIKIGSDFEKAFWQFVSKALKLFKLSILRRFMYKHINHIDCFFKVKSKSHHNILMLTYYCILK